MEYGHDSNSEKSEAQQSNTEGKEVKVMLVISCQNLPDLPSTLGYMVIVLSNINMYNNIII